MTRPRMPAVPKFAAIRAHPASLASLPPTAMSGQSSTEAVIIASGALDGGTATVGLRGENEPQPGRRSRKQLRRTLVGGV